MIGRDAAPHFRDYAELHQNEAADLEALGRELAAARDAIGAERAALAMDLARVYLPSLTRDALAEAERRTGFRGFTQRKPLEALEREDNRLVAKVAKLEADEHWTRRDALVGPHGTWTRDLAEAKDLLDPWERDCARFEALEGFLELYLSGYDTPAYELRWWQPGYWRLWAQGDAICQALELADFGDDVRPAYEKVKEPRDKWRGEVERITQNIARVHDHVRQRDETAWRHTNLTSIYLEECQKVLADHIGRADIPLLAAWAGEDRGVLVHLKRLSGLGAKLDILGEMSNEWVTPSRDRAAHAATKFSLKARKFDRPKKAGLHVDMPVGIEEKVEARAARRAKARTYVQRIVRYDQYDRFDLAQPPETWWLHMNDNRRPSVLTPTLASWYARHPDVVVLVDPDWSDARGEAIVVTRAVLAQAGDIS